MTKTTDNDRVLKALRQGPVAVIDWTGPTTPDGGKPILRMAARILDLKNRGYEIDKVGRRSQCAVYALRQQDREAA